jgi:hypothetical protein
MRFLGRVKNGGDVGSETTCEFYIMVSSIEKKDGKWGDAGTREAWGQS